MDLTRDGLAARAALIDASPALTALRAHLAARAERLLTEMPHVPEVKALLSRDGGHCPDDGSPLTFDPWRPHQHACPRCGRMVEGPRHHAHWARAQHLWLAERAAHLATLHALTGDGRYAARARELLRVTAQRYFALPNRDNVLGPTHLFFSTYLESIWLLDHLAAATLLRLAGALSAEEIAAVDAVADEAAALIGEFNEGFSNRQTWHHAALLAIAAWFEDEDLAHDTLEGPSGLLAHLARGFGEDGAWHEGENYHLFAMRGLLLGIDWARAAGADLAEDPDLAEHLALALTAPLRSALPDLTFPARQDARYGVSLAHPAYAESWEAGCAWLGDGLATPIADGLRRLYAVAPRPEQTYDAWLHDAGEPVTERSRERLSWWALLTMRPDLPPSAGDAATGDVLLPSQGTAILRRGTRHVSLETGWNAVGHGHPDILHLTLHADGIHWLPDPGTGSYVTDDLFWYRSTAAHNAPLLDGVDQTLAFPLGCAAFATSGDWSRAAGRWGDVRRTVVTGPDWVLDLVEFSGAVPHRLELPWHLAGELTTVSAGEWTEDAPPAWSVDRFLRDPARFVPAAAGPLRIAATADGRTLSCWFAGDGSLHRLTGPGLPGAGPAPFLLRRAEGAAFRCVTLLDAGGAVRELVLDDDRESVRVVAEAGATTVRFHGETVTVTTPEGATTLAGAMPLATAAAPRSRTPGHDLEAEVIRVAATPAIDGTLDAFVLDAPLDLAGDAHYFRSETPYPGEEALAATAWLNWSDEALLLAVEVRKDAVITREPDAAPLLLDNESDDIHADGVQLHLQVGEADPVGLLLRPLAAGTALRGLGAWRDALPEGARAGWRRTAEGYTLTAAIPWSAFGGIPVATPLRGDLLVNEMRPDRVRRAGQLVWSDGGGWVYLRGDRHEPARFGTMVLVE